MRVLISGASGLIGGRLMRHLRASAGPDLSIRASSRIARDWPRGVEGIVLDPRRAGDLDAACEDVDTVINLASMGERASAADPGAARRVNADGTRALARAAARAGVNRFVQLSTYKVYGANPGGDITEETPCAPQTEYAATHLAAEGYARSEHPSAVIFRLSNGFGAPVGDVPQCWELIVNGMCRDAVLAREITLRSSGKSWRNFIPVGEVVRALAFAADELPAGTYNLGSPRAMTLAQMANRVATECEETLGYQPVVKLGAASAGEETGPLNFGIQKLRAAGFESSDSTAEEIALTLTVAENTFGRTSHQ